MSFSNDVKSEMLSVQIKKNCCKKAFLFGLLYNADVNKAGEGSVEFSVPESVSAAIALLGGDSAGCSIEEYVKAARRFYRLSFTSKALSNFLYRVECGQSISEAGAFRCDGCAGSFMRGVLISSMTLTDPHKGHHLEISLPERKASRIEVLSDYIVGCGFKPRSNKRQNKVSIYFKNNTQITDILSFSSAMRSSFDYANVCIELEIRNNENRATNCVAKNISKSVDAARRQVDAIKKLIECHKYESLSPELEKTARLRIENEDISLSDLALLHEPPISKSGLNHRLEKICELADECD